jgi:hypothetical protein
MEKITFIQLADADRIGFSIDLHSTTRLLQIYLRSTKTVGQEHSHESKNPIN